MSISAFKTNLCHQGAQLGGFLQLRCFIAIMQKISGCDFKCLFKMKHPQWKILSLRLFL